MDPESKRLLRKSMGHVSVGIEMAIAVAIGSLGGAWLDRHLGTKPWFFWFGFLVGVGAAAKALVRTVRALQKDDS